MHLFQSKSPLSSGRFACFQQLTLLTHLPRHSLYETPTANWPGEEGYDWGVRFLARPVSGGHFALLALDAADAANRQRRGEDEAKVVDAQDLLIQGGQGIRGLKWEKEM